MNKIELLKTRNFDQLELSAAEVETLKGLKHEKAFNAARNAAPRHLKFGKLAQFIKDEIGESCYKQYTSATSTLAYMIRRAEEQEGFEQFKNNDFSNYRGVAFPVINRIVRDAGGEYILKPVTDFTFNSHCILLTNKTGYNVPKHKFQEELIEALKEAIREDVIDGEISLEYVRNFPGGGREVLASSYRLTIERIKK